MKKILLILILILAYSCGAKKSESKKEEAVVNTEKEIKSESNLTIDTVKKEDSNVKTSETKKVSDKDETVIKETTYELNDITKPGKVTTPDGVIELNNVKRTTKETIKKNNTQTEDVKQKDSVGTNKIDIKEVGGNKTNVNEVSNASSTIDENKLDRDQYNFFKSLWFILPVIVITVLIVIYLLYKKFRNKLPI